jgi:hypothetical protein
VYSIASYRSMVWVFAMGPYIETLMKYAHTIDQPSWRARFWGMGHPER